MSSMRILGFERCLASYEAESLLSIGRIAQSAVMESERRLLYMQ